MVFKFKDTKLPYRKRIQDSLTAVFGMGLQRASYACNALGFGMSYNINNINRYNNESVGVIMKYFYILADRLIILLKQRLEYFLEIRLTKGLRIFRGLPVNGQRTHSNRETTKRHKPILAKSLALMYNVFPVFKQKLGKGAKQKRKGKGG